MGTAWKGVVEGVAERCAAFGLDLVQPSCVDEREALNGLRGCLPDLGRPATLALMIGNSKALWPSFLQWLADDPGRLTLLDPLDRYVETGIVESMRKVPYPWRIRWGHEPPPRTVPMQRLADALGLARLSPSKMCIHETFGPWIALRAVVIVDVDGSDVLEPEQNDHCADCEKPCVPLFDEALSLGTRLNGSDEESSKCCEAWVAVRKSCRVGKEHAYDEDQVLYHYTKRPEVLEDALRRHSL